MNTPLTDSERAMCREAVARAVREVRSLDGAPARPYDTAIPAELYPDHVPEPKTVTVHGFQYRAVNGVVEVQTAGGRWTRSSYYTADDICALASLLPKRELTDEIVRKAFEAWRWTPAGGDAIRTALLSVWDDIAGPAAPALKPEWWGVVSSQRILHPADDEMSARTQRGWFDTTRPALAPHRVVALAEVPQP